MDTTPKKPQSVDKITTPLTKEANRNCLSLPKLSQSLIIPENILNLVSCKKKSSISTKLSNTKNSRRDLSKSPTRGSKKSSKSKNNKRKTSQKKMLRNLLKSTNYESGSIESKEIAKKPPLASKKKRLKKFYGKKFLMGKNKKYSSKDENIFEKCVKNQKSIDFRAERLEKIRNRELSQKIEIKIRKLKNASNEENQKKRKSKTIKSANCSKSPLKNFLYFKKYKDLKKNSSSKKIKLNLSKKKKKLLKNCDWKKFSMKKKNKFLSRKNSRRDVKFSTLDKMNSSLSNMNPSNEFTKFDNKFHHTTNKFFAKKTATISNRKKIHKASNKTSSRLIKKLKIKSEKFSRINELKLSNSFDKQKLNLYKLTRSGSNKSCGKKKNFFKGKKMNTETKNIKNKKKKRKNSSKIYEKFLKKKHRKVGSYNRMKLKSTRCSEKYGSLKLSFLKNDKSGLKQRNEDYLKENGKKEIKLKSVKNMKQFLKGNRLLTSPDNLIDEDESQLDKLFISMMLKEDRISVLPQIENSEFLKESFVETTKIFDNFDRIKEVIYFQNRKYYIDDLKDFMLELEDKSCSKEDYEYFKSIFLEHFRHTFFSLRNHRVPKHRQAFEGILNLDFNFQASNVKYLPNCNFVFK